MNQTYRSPVDIFETEHAYIIHAEVPGVNPDAIAIEVEHDTLRLSGTIKRSDEKQEANAVWQRSFQLNKSVDRDAVTADLRDGILQLTLPKPQEAKPKRIAVNAA